MKRRIKLTEGTLHKIIKESVKKVLKESAENFIFYGLDWDGFKVVNGEISVGNPKSHYEEEPMTYEMAKEQAADIAQTLGDWPTFLAIMDMGTNQFCDTYANYSTDFARKYHLPVAKNCNENQGEEFWMTAERLKGSLWSVD